MSLYSNLTKTCLVKIRSFYLEQLKLLSHCMCHLVEHSVPVDTQVSNVS